MELEKRINDLKCKYKEYKADNKFTWEEIIKFILDIMEELVNISEEFFNSPNSGAQKKEWVYEAIKEIYKYVNPNIPSLPNIIETPFDKYVNPNIPSLPNIIETPFENSVNSDIPYLPNIIETPFENSVLNTLVPPLLDSLIALLNKLGIFKHKKDA